ncbi:hydroxymethylglutaryl-CoA synthase family protein [soil metagenome]
MDQRYIQSIGGYLANLRLRRKSAATAMRWSGLGGPRDGRRAVAGWDEDALTMAVEAARGLVGDAAPAAITFASTSAYFIERAQSSLMIDALMLPSTTRATDVSGSRRAATSALLDSLEGRGDRVIAAGEKRATLPGSVQQLSFGDGAAAVRTGDSGPARCIGAVSHAHDFIDYYVSRDHPTPYAYEERFVREAAIANILAPAIRAVCEQAGVTPDNIAFAAVAEPVAGTYPALARTLGLKAPNLASDLLTRAGDLGTAHALFALGLAFDKAAPGDIVLLAGFGSGCDALLFELDGPVPGASAMTAALDAGEELTDYVRFLNLAGALDMAWGMRAEFGQKAQATVLARHNRDMMGFIGGRDSAGNVQFPKTRIPVNPALSAPETLEDVRLADDIAHIVSITADRLNFTPDPPFDFGLVQFDNGARIMMELIDRPAGGFSVGDTVQMRLRIKSMDRKLGFRTYFWKAAPVERAPLETL